jgi:branched-chain amino acid transport system permease protein
MKPFSPSALLLFGAGGMLVFGPCFFQDGDLYYRVLGLSCFYAALALAWNILALTGSISIGHTAFFGLGAYTSALVSHYTQLPPLLCVALGGVSGMAYGIAWHIAFKPLRGARYALATLASVEIPRVIVDNWEGLTFGSLGLAGIPALPELRAGDAVISLGESLKSQYYFLLLLMAACGLIHYKSIHSPWGWAMRAVREDEMAAGAIGVPVDRIRLGAVMVSALLTALCGAIYGHLMGLIEPALVFSLHLSALPLVLSIFGGRYQFYGPILGSLVLYPADQLFFHAWLPSGHAALYGLVIILTFILFPSGIGAWLQQRLK